MKLMRGGKERGWKGSSRRKDIRVERVRGWKDRRRKGWDKGRSENGKNMEEGRVRLRRMEEGKDWGWEEWEEWEEGRIENKKDVRSKGMMIGECGKWGRSEGG